MLSCATFFMSCISWQERLIPSQNFITTQHFDPRKNAVNNNQYCLCAIPTMLKTNILNSKQPLILYLLHYGLLLSAASHSGPLQHFKSLKLLLWLIILLGHIKIRLIRLIIDCTTFRYVGARKDILFRGSGGRDRRRKWCVLWVQWWM